ncbi:MAG TPA: hypothetical protein V6C52_12260 [Coleofasciculaceae cyanobacterium]|jgi:hypothetical protein
MEQLPPSVLSGPTTMAPLERLMGYVRQQAYEGWDLYDGLNSRLFKPMPLYRSSWFRLGLIQLCKRSPVNLRSLLMVPKGFNPKGGALFLMGYLNLFRHTHKEVYSNEAYLLFQRLKRTVIPREHGVAWGYNFDWQARAFYVPLGTPNLVTSVYVGRTLLEYYRVFSDDTALEMALAVSVFILREMIKFESADSLCFTYIPGREAEVHNANLLGAAYLAETLPYQPVHWIPELKTKILKAVRFSVADIALDGSWPYGTMPFHRWVDNFHTAFNLECLLRISDILDTDEFRPVLGLASKYYLRQLFTAEGLPKYYHDRLYPIDVHVIAEAIVLLNLFREHCLIPDADRMVTIERALRDLLSRFQDTTEGYFYHQQTEKSWNRIPYMRWGQAWMFYALSTCLR